MRKKEILKITKSLRKCTCQFIDNVKKTNNRIAITHHLEIHKTGIRFITYLPKSQK